MDRGRDRKTFKSIISNTMKELIKRLLVSVGLRHPAKGVKVSQARKAEVLLAHITSAMTDFIETGTYQGGMVEALRPHFKEIYSIEFNDDLYHFNDQKFRDDKNVHLYHGDSAKEIQKILKLITKPALFWLDAHGSGEITFQNSPIEAELIAIFNHSVRGHVIVIDDARHFSHHNIRAMHRLARSHNYRTVIEEGLFRLIPNR